MFFAVLFTIARTCKQPRCPSTDEWIKKLWHVYTVGFYSAIKRNAFESILMRWMNLELIIQSEVSQKEKNKYHILMNIYIWNLEKWYWWIYLQGSKGDADIENRLVDTMGKGATAKSLQSCPTLCDPIDGSPPGSPVPGILQARTLEWIAISFPNAGKWSRSVVPDS